VFVFTFSFIWIKAFTNDPDYTQSLPTDPDEQYKIVFKCCWQSIQSALLFILSFAYLNPYIETVQNPWMQRLCRCVLNTMLLYMCFLIFMLNQRPEFGRRALGFLDPNLNQVITKEMHTYGDDCELTWKRFWDDIDHYYLVHWIDYFVATFLLRDALICHFWHLFFEVLELSAQHRLPHFAECWWDHILTDILLSNIPATILGLWCMDKLGIRRFDWLGRYGKKTISEWEVFHCHRRFGNNCLQLICFTLHFLASFFLMNAFLIPPTHRWVACRMILWAGMGGLGFREAYMDSETWNTEKRKT